MTPCENQHHPKFHSGMIELCYVCHWRTDQAFAFWSQELLARIKGEALQEAA